MGRAVRPQDVRPVGKPARNCGERYVEKLKLQVAGGRKSLAKHYTDSNEAYQLYLKGRFQWNNGRATPLVINRIFQSSNERPGFGTRLCRFG